MNKLLAVLGFAFFLAPFAHAKECSAPPVTSSAQALCYATAYAKKNSLSHGASLKKRTAKKTNAWTVSFTDTRANAPSKGWQVDVDQATGTVTRFASYKKPDR
jgi:hypothetical protein